MIGKYYLAARYPRRVEMEGIANAIRAKDDTSDCVARWVFGGEEGLTRPQIAALDLNDVHRCDTFILFTHKRGSKQPGGGRFVEFGYALAKGKRCIIIGDYENVFVSTAGVDVYPTLEEFFHNEVPVVK